MQGFKVLTFIIKLLEDGSNSILGKGPSSTNLVNKDLHKGLFNLFIKQANFKNPGILVWTLLLIKLSISQKYIKFTTLVVCKGYLLKWAIIILSSHLDLTLNLAYIPTIETEPTEKKFLI